MSAHNSVMVATEPSALPAAGAVPSRNGHDPDERDAALYHAIRTKVAELSVLVLPTSDPGEAAAYALGYLRGRLIYDFDLIYGRYRAPALDGGEAERLALLEHLSGGFDSD